MQDSASDTVKKLARKQKRAKRLAKLTSPKVPKNAGLRAATVSTSGYRSR